MCQCWLVFNEINMTKLQCNETFECFQWTNHWKCDICKIHQFLPMAYVLKYSNYNSLFIFQRHPNCVMKECVLVLHQSKSRYTFCTQYTSTWHLAKQTNGRIRLPISTLNHTYVISGITHATPFRKYGKHSTGLSTYWLWVRSYSKLFSCKSVLTICSYRAQSNEICMYGRASRGSLPRVRRYGLLYLRTVKYDLYHIWYIFA